MIYVLRNTLAEMVKQQKAIQARDKKNLTHLSAEAKNRLLALREQKQTSRFMLPDAPAEKRKRFELILKNVKHK